MKSRAMVNMFKILQWRIKELYASFIRILLRYILASSKPHKTRKLEQIWPRQQRINKNLQWPDTSMKGKPQTDQKCNSSSFTLVLGT